MASSPNRLELMRRAKARKVTALRNKISESRRQLVAGLSGTGTRRPRSAGRRRPSRGGGGTL